MSYLTVLFLFLIGRHFRKVTTDIYDDAERQNLVLDETVRFFYFFLLPYFTTDIRRHYAKD
jgi:hypothetical protein